ncbi:MAG: transferase, partial [Acidobacteriota bacterium]|nr:transferase [Acidobacteriota bacterium]
AGRDVAELGTAFGEGAAAMAETARSVVTVEVDPARAAIARGRLTRFSNVELVEGDWRSLRGAFALVFADADVHDWDRVLTLVAPGGLLVKDDLTPGRAIAGDPAREFLLRDPRLAAAEILTTPETAAIVAVRR